MWSRFSLLLLGIVVVWQLVHLVDCGLSEVLIMDNNINDLYCGLARPVTTQPSPVASSELQRVDGQTRIHNGSSAEMGEFPFMVNIKYKKRKGRGYRHKCGGVIIGHQHILTAKHCFERLNMTGEHQTYWGNYTFYVGDFNQDVKDGELRISVDEKNVEHHSELDLTIMKTNKPMNFHLDGLGSVNSICLPTESWKYNINSPVIVIGWGLNQFNHTQSTLQVAIVNIVHCGNDIRSKIIEWNPLKHVCTTNRQQGSCNGDSGGPIFAVNPSGSYELIGIVHGAAGFCPETPKLFSTDVYQARHWIHRAITGYPPVRDDIVMLTG